MCLSRFPAPSICPAFDASKRMFDLFQQFAFAVPHTEFQQIFLLYARTVAGIGLGDNFLHLLQRALRTLQQLRSFVFEAATKIFQLRSRHVFFLGGAEEGFCQ